MRKILIATILILMVVLNACSNNDRINFDINDNSSIEVIYYEKFSENQSESYYDILSLSMTKDQFSNYTFFNQVLNEASEIPYDNHSIILGIPIGTYEINVTNDDGFGITIKFRLLDSDTYEFEITENENAIAYKKYTFSIEDNMEISDFMSYVQENGVSRQIS